MTVTPEDLAKMNQPVNPDDYTDPTLKAQAQEMNRLFTQTQQALQAAIRDRKEWETKLPDMELMAKEHTWMRNNGPINSYLEGVRAGTINPNDPQGMATANRGNPQPNNGAQPPAVPNQSGFDWSTLPDPMVDSGQFGSQLQQGISSMIGPQVTEAVTAVMNNQFAPLLRELTNREVGRSTSEQEQRFGAMEATYPDWAQVKDAVLADLKAYPGMDLGKAYRGNGGSGQTFAEASRANLTPASGVKRNAEDGPKDPKSWDSTAEFVEQRFSELTAPAPAQPGTPGLPGLPGIGSQPAPAGVLSQF